MVIILLKDERTESVKRLFCVLTAFLVLVCSPALAITVYKVTVNVSFLSNLLFSKYDVDLYLNDLQLEKLSHGQDYTGSFFVEDGTNYIYFYQSGNKGIYGMIPFNATGNTVIDCSISCTKDEVRVNFEVSVKEGECAYSSADNNILMNNSNNLPAASDNEPKAEKTEISGVTTVDEAVSYSVGDKDKPLFSQETARKAVLAGICNDKSLDVLTNDCFDRLKFHGYRDFEKKLMLVDEGVWTQTDNNNAWHVSDFLIRDKEKSNGWYYKYDFDVRFDGTNYRLENGYMIGASQIKYFDKKDPSKFDERDLSDLDFYTIFIVAPNQIGE